MVSAAVVMLMMAICGIVLASVSLTAYSGTNAKPKDQNWGFSIFALVFSIILFLIGGYMMMPKSLGAGSTNAPMLDQFTLGEQQAAASGAALNRQSALSKGLASAYASLRGAAENAQKGRIPSTPVST